MHLLQAGGLQGTSARAVGLRSARQHAPAGAPLLQRHHQHTIGLHFKNHGKRLHTCLENLEQGPHHENQVYTLESCLNCEIMAPLQQGSRPETRR